jgi:hypothetical protein
MTKTKLEPHPIATWYFQHLNPLILSAGEVRVYLEGGKNIVQMWFTKPVNIDIDNGNIAGDGYEPQDLTFPSPLETLAEM